MTIILNYKGWLITDKGCEHGCPYNHNGKNHLDAKWMDEKRKLDIPVIFCTLCGEVMPKQVENHLKTILILTNPHLNR